MTELAIWAIVLGGLKFSGSLYAWLRPGSAIGLAKAFPRSVWPGRILSAIDFVWAALLLNAMPMGHFDSWKVALYVLCPLAIILVPIYLDELLSPRALGGLYLLLAAPILDAARWHPSSWSVVMSVVAYIMVIAGIAFVLAPYLLNRMLVVGTGNESRCRAFAILGCGFGLLLICLGIFVY